MSAPFPHSLKFNTLDDLHAWAMQTMIDRARAFETSLLMLDAVQPGGLDLDDLESFMEEQRRAIPENAASLAVYLDEARPAALCHGCHRRHVRDDEYIKLAQ